MTVKIAVIGAGPAGLYIANLLHNESYDITIFEEHGFIGSNHCTGIISETTFRMLNVKREITLNKVKSIVITDLKNSVKFKLKDDVLIINRPKLEESLLNNIEGSVHLRLNRKVLKIDSDGHVVTRDGVEKFDLIINAEGSKGVITKSIIPSWKYDYIYGLQCDCKIVKDHYLIPSSDDEVVVIFNSKLSRCFFSW
ncbi:MAG: monooxygenase, partial [Thermoprotei archaeon ex4572_64]